MDTRAHFDHDAVEQRNVLVVLERLVGQFKLGDIEVTGLPTSTNVNRRPTISRIEPPQISRLRLPRQAHKIEGEVDSKV